MRQEGWEERLEAVLAAAAARPYAVGTSDCFRLACDVVEALTGIERWSEWAGRYGTEREALRLLAEYGSTFEAAFDWFFGVPRVGVRLARRGDIAAYTDARGQKHLGVVIGAQALVYGPDGLVRVGLLECGAAWRVG